MSLAPAACEPEEAARAQLDVVVDGGAATLPVTTDLGYEVHLTSARVVIADPVFTTGGEVHGDRGGLPLLGAAWSLLVPSAAAHPGHYAGGEVIGELPGRYTFDWVVDDGMILGTADLIEGTYEGVNFGLDRGRADDGIPNGDPLLDSSAVLEGEATRGGQTVSWSATIRQDDGVAVIGAIFEHEVREGDESVLNLALLPGPEIAEATLFDGIDFFALEATEGHVELVPETPEANRLRKALQSHDFYAVTATTP